MKLIRKLASILLIAALAVIISYFAKVNDARVNLDFVFYSFSSVPLWLLVLFSFLGGILFTVILVFVDILVVNVKERKLRKENKILRKELSKMRNQKLESIDDPEDAGYEKKSEEDDIDENEQDSVDEEEID